MKKKSKKRDTDELLQTDQERLSQSLFIAEKIQKHLLPAEFEPSSGLDVYARSRPSDEIGGDFYQILKLVSGETLFAMGDAAGHGLPSAMVSIMVDTLLHAFANNADLRETLITMNSILHKRIDPSLFSTLVLLLWNQAQQRFSIASAGFGRFLHFHAHNEHVEIIKAGGIALGMVADNSQQVGLQVCTMGQDDILVICTDGILEMRNVLGERLGIERWKKLVLAHVHAGTAEQIFEAISRDLLVFAGTMKQVDDITLMVIRRIC